MFHLHSSSIIFAVSNEGFRWSLNFGPDSVVLTVKDLVREMTLSSREIRMPAWNLLLSRRQEFLDNHLARSPINPNQQGTHQKREEVLSSSGAQDKDTSGYEVSDLNDI